MREKVHKIGGIITACLPALIFITWLNAYYWLLENGRYKAFIQPKLWPLLILALVLLLAFSAAIISQFSLQPMAVFQFDAWIKAAILIVPVVFLWTIYGHSLGTDAFANRLFQTDRNVPLNPANLTKTPSETRSGNPTTLLDLILYAETYKGKPVVVEGMVYRGAKVDQNSFMLFRFAVTCCAADALPFSIRVETPIDENLANDTWVRVEGRFHLESIDDKQASSIEAGKVLPIPTPAPEKRYMFFGVD